MTTDHNKPIIVLTTHPDENKANALAETLVSQKLAACINILPAMTSVYEWQGKLESGREHLLIIKTTQAAYAKLEKTIQEQHPYELPEILVLPVESGLSEYLSWIANHIHY